MFGRIKQTIRQKSGAILDWFIGASAEAQNLKGQIYKIEEKINTMAEDQKTQQAQLGADLQEIEAGQAAERERGEKMIADQEAIIQSLQEKQANSGVDLSAEIATAERILQAQKDSFAAQTNSEPAVSSDASASEATSPAVSTDTTTAPEIVVQPDAGATGETIV